MSGLVGSRIKIMHHKTLSKPFCTKKETHCHFLLVWQIIFSQHGKKKKLCKKCREPSFLPWNIDSVPRDFPVQSLFSFGWSPLPFPGHSVFGIPHESGPPSRRKPHDRLDRLVAPVAEKEPMFAWFLFAGDMVWIHWWIIESREKLTWNDFWFLRDITFAPYKRSYLPLPVFVFS